MHGTVINNAGSAALTNVSIGSGTRANLGAVDIRNGSLNGTVINNVSGMTATNVAVGSGAEANSGSVVIKNAGAGGAINNSGAGVVVNDFTVPFGSISGQNVNVAIGGGTSNKNSVVVK